MHTWQVDQLELEIKMLSKLDHDNIVKYYSQEMILSNCVALSDSEPQSLSDSVGLSDS